MEGSEAPTCEKVLLVSFPIKEKRNEKMEAGQSFDAFLSRVSNKLLPERNGEGGFQGTM